jgi:hypothetical protein
MRGADAMQEGLFTVAKLDDFVPSDHPLRAIRLLVNDALAAMNTRFNAMYADSGRDSRVLPDRIIERQPDKPAKQQAASLGRSTFSKNRDRLLAHQVVEGLFTEISAPGRGAWPAVQRALLGRRHADPSVGQPEELSTQGRQ